MPKKSFIPILNRFNTTKLRQGNQVQLIHCGCGELLKGVIVDCRRDSYNVKITSDGYRQGEIDLWKPCYLRSINEPGDVLAWQDHKLIPIRDHK